DEHLPVAVVQVAQAAAGDLELALGRAVGEVVNGGERRAEIIAKADALRGQAHEDEPAVGGEIFYEREPAPGFALGEARAVVALGERNVEDRAVQTVGPGV